MPRLPKKDAERIRRNKTPEAGGSWTYRPADVVDVDGMTLPGAPYPPDPKWHPIATKLWDAQCASGQSLWMEPSDWAVLFTVCESLSRDMKPQVIGVNEETGRPVRATIPLKGASLSAYTKVLAELMMTEGSRRKLRLELERSSRQDDAPAATEDIVGDRRALFRVV